ncbi:hypothetical protein ILYODFUR_034851 [Ilyodon furcidens]|uniref:Uncharacterized protein n=1 Tax=Ilyodon furcidens TaxID=33524 RepID=A0ABV0T6D1_9TELE
MLHHNILRHLPSIDWGVLRSNVQRLECSWNVVRKEGGSLWFQLWLYFHWITISTRLSNSLLYLILVENIIALCMPECLRECSVFHSPNQQQLQGLLPQQWLQQSLSHT